MKLKKFTGILLITLITSMSKFCAGSTLRAWIFSNNTVGDSEGTYASALEGSHSVLDLISLVNRYLWFAIGFFCFVFMIWNGYKLISANGDDKATESAKKALLGAVIGLAVCLLAYIIVNLAVKLFK